MADFKAILSKPIEEIKAPPPMPVGSYLGRVKGHEIFESPNTKTMGVRFTIVPYQAGSDVDQDLLKAIGGISDKEMKTTFWITEDAAFRLREFLENDIGATGSNLETLIPQATNQAVGFYVKQGVTKDGRPFSEIAKTFKADLLP